MAQDKVNPAVISIIIIVLIGAGVGAFYLANNEQEVDSQDTNTQTSTSSSDESSADDGAPTSPSSLDSAYANGTYSATGNYSTPGGTENVTVEVMLKGGIVESVEATGSATGGNSAQYQSQFLSAYQSEVVGKPIDEVRLSRVAGSSLTSSGFNDALETIKNEARS